MTDLEKKLIAFAGKHSEYDESTALAELKYLNETDSDLIANLWTLHVSYQEKGIIGTENPWNSHLAYFLKVTKCKSTKIFSIDKRRTYGRIGFPDIDMDFDYLRRVEIVEYLIEKYGREYVGNIGNVQTLKTKAAVRRAIKVLDPTNSVHFDQDNKEIKTKVNENFALENEILQTLPSLMKRGNGSLVESIDEACEEYPHFSQYMTKYPEVFRIAKELEGTVAGFGVHAAGLLLSPIPLSKIAPMHVTRKTGGTDEDGKPERVIATQFPMAEVERMGLIKFDILGLSTKTAISWACSSLAEKGIEVDWNKIPLNDKETLDLLHEGYTDGCFQLENPGMKECLKTIGIDSFDDLVVAVAMYRPGPKDYIPEFAGRKRKHITVSYAHSLLKDITESTYGIIVYQEQVMKAFMVLADLTASDGYAFMKGCAKKNIDLINVFKEKFFKGSASAGLTPREVQGIWDDLYKFSGYAFNKSHSVSYAYESYKTAYLKAHHPTEFIAARLSVETRRRNFDDVEKYKKDAKKHFGFTLEPVDINKSKLDWSIEGDKILRTPILTKGVGIKAAEDIVLHQPYTGKDVLLSFGRKVGKAVNTKTIEAMKDAGFWKSIAKEKLVSDFDQIKKDRKRTRGRSTMDLFA
jgi:DNA polymerase-3 subunit alpha